MGAGARLRADPDSRALLAGLILGMIQAATSINEQTLTFVPKLIVVGSLHLPSSAGRSCCLSPISRGTCSPASRI